MLLEQADRDRPQCARRRGHLGEDVNAVLIFFDHPLQAANLAFDPAQPLQIIVLVLGVSVHAALRVPPSLPHCIPRHGMPPVRQTGPAFSTPPSWARSPRCCIASQHKVWVWAPSWLSER